MACSNCGGGGSCGGCGGCGPCCVADDCAVNIQDALDSLKNKGIDFCKTGIPYDDEVCENLGNNKGILGNSTTCSDLQDALTALLGDINNRICSGVLCNEEELRRLLADFAKASTMVDRLQNCSICGIFEIMQCLNAKSQQSVLTVDLWEGNQNIFSLPTLTLSQNLSNFTYLDLHVLLGTEHQVIRISLEGGLAGVPTAVHVDKTGGNSDYAIVAGATIAKEIGLTFPASNSLRISHFIWSVMGSSTPTLDTATPAVHIAFSNTANSKAYCDSQDTTQDRPHTLLKVEGIISQETASCM